MKLEVLQMDYIIMSDGSSELTTADKIGGMAVVVYDLKTQQQYRLFRHSRNTTNNKEELAGLALATYLGWQLCLKGFTCCVFSDSEFSVKTFNEYMPKYRIDAQDQLKKSSSNELVKHQEIVKLLVDLKANAAQFYNKTLFIQHTLATKPGVSLQMQINRYCNTQKPILKAVIDNYETVRNLNAAADKLASSTAFGEFVSDLRVAGIEELFAAAQISSLNPIQLKLSKNCQYETILASSVSLNSQALPAEADNLEEELVQSEEPVSQVSITSASVEIFEPSDTFVFETKSALANYVMTPEDYDKLLSQLHTYVSERVPRIIGLSSKGLRCSSIRNNLINKKFGSISFEKLFNFEDIDTKSLVKLAYFVSEIKKTAEKIAELETHSDQQTVIASGTTLLVTLLSGFTYDSSIPLKPEFKGLFWGEQAENTLIVAKCFFPSVQELKLTLPKEVIESALFWVEKHGKKELVCRVLNGKMFIGATLAE